MDMNIKVVIDLDDYVGRWCEESLAEEIKYEVKQEVIKNVKATQKYRDIVVKQQDAMMKKLLDD